MDQIKIFAPATIGNVGPGFDILGLAVEGLGDIITCQKSSIKSEITAVTGVDAALIPLDPAQNTITLAAHHFCKKKGANLNLSFTLERQLPASGGMGASAASSLAGAMAAAYFTGNLDDHLLILGSALEAEAVVSGRHLDNIAPCYYGGLTLVQAIDPPNVVVIPVKKCWWVALLTPAIKLDTKHARSILPRTVDTKIFIQQMANTAALVAAFAQGNEELAGAALCDLFAEPKRGALIPRFDDIKLAALGSGALGCSISGAGPTIFALCDNAQSAQSVVAAMEAAAHGGCRTHCGPIAQKGARFL